MAKKPNLLFDLSIVIPAYCEEKRIGTTLDKLSAYLQSKSRLSGKRIEVLVVSCDSPDNTHNIIRSKQKQFAHFKFLKPGPKVGKGRDVQYGMLRARGDKVVYMDADLATPLRHLSTFYDACDRGADIVVGTRNLLKHHPSTIRRTISYTGNILFRLVSGLWIEDSQCGFKMFNRRANEICFSKMTIQQWGFDMEILAIAKANDLKIKCRRINDWKDMPNSTFTNGMMSNSLRSLRDLGHIMLNRFKGLYKA